MDVQLEPGTYVVAVSGGVDSLALLHMLYAKNWRAKQNKSEASTPRFIVAHFDHGIRDDTEMDRKFVQSVARAYGLPFVFDEGHLGQGASEATARAVRYAFLERVRAASNSRAIITAHHQDDALETAILNMSRGTGPRGLSSLGDRPGFHRPLLHVPKEQLIAYAQATGLPWREDSTNANQLYTRNYIRHAVLPRFQASHRDQLWRHIEYQRSIKRELDASLINLLHQQSEAGTIDRSWFNRLPHNVSREILAMWLRLHELHNYDRKMLERLVVAAKTASPGRYFPIYGETCLHVGTKNLALVAIER